jgi:hypothetical protein
MLATYLATQIGMVADSLLMVAANAYRLRLGCPAEMVMPTAVE